MKYKIRGLLTGIVFVAFLATSAFAATSSAAKSEEEDPGPDPMDCGAAGDNCQSPEWKEYFDIAFWTFKDDNWPMVGFRMFAWACVGAPPKTQKSANPTREKQQNCSIFRQNSYLIF